MVFCGKKSENGYACFKKGIGVGLGIESKKNTEPNHANHFTKEDLIEEKQKNVINQLIEAEKILKEQKEKQREKATKQLEERLQKRNETKSPIQKTLQLESSAVKILSKPMKKIDILSLLDDYINQLYKLYELESSELNKKKIDSTSDGFEELYDAVNQHQSDDSEMLTIIKDNQTSDEQMIRDLYGYDEIDQALRELEEWFESK